MMKFRFSSIADMLQKQAQERANQISLLYPDQSNPRKYATLTYKQLNNVTSHLAQRFARCLNEQVTSGRQIVCLLANSSVNYLLSLYALLKLDVVVFPLSIRNSDAAILHLLKAKEASDLFYQDQYLSKAIQEHIQSDNMIKLHPFEDISIAELLELGEATFEPMADADEIERVRIIFHSSGSTSFPKPISLKTRCLFGYFETYALEMNGQFWTDKDTVLAGQPLFHMGGVSMSIALWYVGGTYAMPLTSVFPPSPSELFLSIQDPQITKMFTVAVFLEQLVKFFHQNNEIGFQALARLDFVAYGGAACPLHIAEELVENGVNLITTYGSTEMGFVMISDCDTNKKDRWKWMRPMRVRQDYVHFIPIATDSHIYELVVSSRDPLLAPGLVTEKFHLQNANIQFDTAYAPGDLFLENPIGSELYIIQGRKDDVLVHTNGEKTNPLPIELTLRQHTIIENAIVLGHQRFCCAVLIELNIDEASRYTSDEINISILEAVKVANKEAPDHSHILPALIKILPKEKRLAITGKGNVLRNQVETEYADVINQMYEDFFRQREIHREIRNNTRTRSWTHDTICKFIKQQLAEVLNKPIETFTNHSISFFCLSLTSLTITELYNRLCAQFGPLEHSIVYEFSSIMMLTDEIWRVMNTHRRRTHSDLWHYSETEDIIDKYIEEIRKWEEPVSIPVTNLSNREHSKACEKRVFVITGANGSLGSHILTQLHRRPEVTRIYCLVRGNNPLQRLRSSMTMRKQDSTVLSDTTRIVVLSVNFNDEKLGQTENIYHELQHEVTDIVHSAWKMNFNMTIRDFDQECLQGLYNLLQFARSTVNRTPMRFHFISSIGTCGSGLLKIVNEEAVPRRPGLAIAHGYAQAKYAAEHICQTAMDLWDVPVDIYRVGQIGGDSTTGAWNTNEMIPLIICKSGGDMGILPDHLQTVDWIPVNFAALCIVDIALMVDTDRVSLSERVHHILNPHTISWHQLLEYLTRAGLSFKQLSLEEWLHRMVITTNNQMGLLNGFFERMSNDNKDFHHPEYSLKKTSLRTSNLQKCPAISQELIQSYLEYWTEIGFLKRK